MANGTNSQEMGSRERSNSADAIEILAQDKVRSQDPAIQLQWPYMPLLPPNLQIEITDVKQLYDQQKKYLDIWIHWDNKVKLFSRIFMALTMIGASIMGVVAGVHASPTLSFVTAGLAAIGALREPLEKLFIEDLTTKYRMKCMTKCNVIRECLNGVYLLYLIAKEDNRIDQEETKQYQKLINDMHVKLFDIDAESMSV